WLSYLEWLAAACAILFAHFCLFRNLSHPAVCCDAEGYSDLSEAITHFGITSPQSYSLVRTYGYPLFLAVLRLLQRGTSLPFRLVILEWQLAFYLFAAWLLRREIARSSRHLAALAFIGLCANVFVLIYTAEMLTESLSLTISVLLAACWLWSVRVFRSKRYLLAVFTGSALAGYGVMVRPANLYLVGAWVVGQVILAWKRRMNPRSGEWKRRAAALALMSMGIVLPMVPQTYNNLVIAEKLTPLIAADLG